MRVFGKVLRAIYGGPWYKRIVVWLSTLIAALLLLLLAVDNNFLNLFGQSPGFSDINNPVTCNASEIYSADSILIGRFFSENRTPVEYADISPRLLRTLIATEDARFYHHHGIDVPALGSAFVDMLKGRARGASTITQQLAKNLFRVRSEYSTGLLGRISGVSLGVMKAKEWIVAVKLEMTYSKEEILTMYLNTVDFGSNSFGIKTAARTFFGTTPDNLTYEQSAMLVGMLKATSAYNPRRHSEAAMQRRNVVLQNLFDNGGLILNGYPATAQQLDSIKALPIVLSNRSTESVYDGPADYFRMQLQEHINKLCDQGLVNGGDNQHLDLYADGLRIYTTLDMRLQRYAEQAVALEMRVIQQRFDEHWKGITPWRDSYGREIPGFIENIAKQTSRYKQLAQRFPDQPDSIDYYMNEPHTVKLFSYDGPMERTISTMDSIRYMVSFMHCGLLAIEPDTRRVRAWVGDISSAYWKYDKVTSRRQAGSTFKLFVYTEAMNQGLTPCDTRLDGFHSYPDTVDGVPRIWAPHNAEGVFSNRYMTLKTAFARSTNSIAAMLGYEVGVKNIAATAHAMGIESRLEPVPALSLGASDVTLFELVNAYSTVIDDGNYAPPILVTRIEDQDGHVLFEDSPQRQQAIPYRSAALMQQMLIGGMHGTSSYLWHYVRPYARTTDFGGKTGTSNNHSDAWFVAVTPHLTVGAWVGGEYRSIHFRTGELGQGNRTALPVCGRFLQSVLSDSRFAYYQAHFKPLRDGVERSAYECAAWMPPLESDSTSSSLDSPAAVTIGEAAAGGPTSIGSDNNSEAME
ncbi:MAG: penicillin-binding protein [Bacteroidaceae bacterium]|nr:penicillin-binding protein [Bacteroidaceae bacterium]